MLTTDLCNTMLHTTYGMQISLGHRLWCLSEVRASDSVSGYVNIERESWVEQQCSGGMVGQGQQLCHTHRHHGACMLPSLCSAANGVNGRC